ncbi:glycine-sarcosine methyltransferase [Rhodococcus ruber BKS 20-38]|uniref:Glycine-sarcosine methyltransferase n=1 Tax=Rhodococcus ruber BKS 20-38 TaxID=1278076 RepID=M2XZE0_9NOCA|nr:class I SAM-dependent methyltransferase [Rhodococcus ruber]EME66251.1 glycine-sarcosine methyltransferase [Rhodococcus ruber BKS 20-38]
MTTTSIVEHPAEIIDIYLRVCADEDRFVAQSVAAFDTVGLNGPVLDCAVGTGFGTLRLLEAGYPLVCSDGSVDMLRRFRLNCAEAGLSHDAVHARWEDLGRVFPAVFDMVMCRGNSLAYADTWDNDVPLEHDLDRLATHVAGMAGALRPGGALLVDLPATRPGAASTRLLEHRGSTTVGEPVTVVEQIHTDPTTRLRRWNVTMTVGTHTCQFSRSSYLIDLDTLRTVLRLCGFAAICTLPDLSPRDHYSTVVAIKERTRPDHPRHRTPVLTSASSLTTDR